MYRAVRFFCVVALLASTIACQSKEAKVEEAKPAEAPANRVEAATLGVAIADLPDFFQLVSNDGEIIVVEPADGTTLGRVTLVEEPVLVGGVNLVAGVEAHQAEIEGRPEGTFRGQRELGGPLGTAFYSRGHYAGDTTTMEETKVFMMHPRGDSMLVLTYTYPAGDDSSARVQDQLLPLMGEIEPLIVDADGDAAADDAT